MKKSKYDVSKIIEKYFSIFVYQINNYINESYAKFCGENCFINGGNCKNCENIQEKLINNEIIEEKLDCREDVLIYFLCYEGDKRFGLKITKELIVLRNRLRYFIKCFNCNEIPKEDNKIFRIFGNYKFADYRFNYYHWFYEENDFFPFCLKCINDGKSFVTKLDKYFFPVKTISYKEYLKSDKRFKKCRNFKENYYVKLYDFEVEKLINRW